MNEAQTKHDLIEPALREAGWGIVEGSRLRLEFPITKGRLIGQNRRATPLFADYVLEYKNRRIGVVEAKKRDLYYTDGVGQAKDYAERLNIRFSYATNGLKIYGIDLEEATEGDVSKYPTPDQLWEMTYPTPKEDYKVEIANWKERLFAIPFEDRGGTWQPRYYQQNAIAKVLEAISEKKDKILLTLATGTRTPTGKYFVSILCDTGEYCKSKSNIKKETTVGIDLGIKDFLITSDCEVSVNPTYLRKAESRLKYIQRKYSKHKGKRTRNKLAKLHEKVANQRRDFLHKESFELVSENQTISIEDLNVKGMLKNHCLAKSISDAGWSMFTTMLEYKCEWYGVNLLKIGRFEPSSKTCFNCGKVNKELTLKDREWTCVKCNTKHDRDINAAVNIKNFALRNYVSGTDTETQNELPTLVGVLTSEAQPNARGVGG